MTLTVVLFIFAGACIVVPTGFLVMDYILGYDDTDHNWEDEDDV